jgi:hypothetical protein
MVTPQDHEAMTHGEGRTVGKSGVEFKSYRLGRVGALSHPDEKRRAKRLFQTGAHFNKPGYCACHYWPKIWKILPASRRKRQRQPFTGFSPLRYFVGLPLARQTPFDPIQFGDFR